MAHRVKDFLQKRWVRILGVFPASLYTYLAVKVTIGVIEDTVFRPPNIVFPMTDLIGWMGYFFFSGIVIISGIMAVSTAYFMRGFFKVLYLAGLLGIIGPMAYMPLSFVFNAEYDFVYDLQDQDVLVGEWKDSWHELTLNADSSFALFIDGRWLFWGDTMSYSGRWTTERNKILFNDTITDWTATYEVLSSDGYRFITYSIPDNFDAWNGNLGMMRSDEWDSTH